jgi:hypothetical protein
MGVPTLEVGYISATTGRGDHEVHKGHVVALEEKKRLWLNSDVEYQLNVSELSVVVRVLVKRISGYLTTDHDYFLEFHSTEVSLSTKLDQSS